MIDSSMAERLRHPENLRVTIMGLGLHGGGLASALYFASRGARVTVTDLKDRDSLKSSIAQLESPDIRLVLGEHRQEDFVETDLVIKNPAVPASSAFLQASRSNGIPIETDVSIFLQLSENPVIGVTGSKGKSTVASAIHQGLLTVFPGAKLGGNITVSPLSFIGRMDPEAPVVLELSSWQLGDLRGRGLLKPEISLITSILPDHMNRYSGMDEYIADKTVLFLEQEADSFALFNRDDPYQKDFARKTEARSLFFSARRLGDEEDGAYLSGNTGTVRWEGKETEILPEALSIPGLHNRMNLLAAGLALFLFNVPPERIKTALGSFKGLEHRLEPVAEYGGFKFYNDSAATIPQATIQALKSIPGPIVLIMGGTDKAIDFAPLEEAAGIPSEIVLLSGTATEKVIALFERLGRSYHGPVYSLEEALDLAVAKAPPGASILFSPGSTSFGMFQNEFDRGRRFKELVRRKAEQGGKS